MSPPGARPLAVLFVALAAAACGSDAPATASPDAAPTAEVDAGSCSIFPDNEGCPAPMACDLDPDDGFYCRDAVSDARDATTCAGRSDCDIGWTCAGSGTPRCQRYCDDHDDCPDGRCAKELGNGLEVCTTACALEDADGCPVGFGCHPAGDGVSDCFVAGTTAAGATCVETAECLPGFVCLDPPGGGGGDVCVQYCRITEPGSACEVGTCESLMTVGSVEYGACI